MDTIAETPDAPDATPAPHPHAKLVTTIDGLISGLSEIKAQLKDVAPGADLPMVFAMRMPEGIYHSCHGTVAEVTGLAAEAAAIQRERTLPILVNKLLREMVSPAGHTPRR